MKIRQLLLELHEEYNRIFDEQVKLPQKPGKKDYSLIEENIVIMSRNLINRINALDEKIRENDELLNIIDGCNKLINNQYKRFGGRVNLE